MSVQTEKMRTVIILFLMVLAVTPVAGDEGSLPLKAEMTATFTGGISNLYVSGDPSVVWKPGLFGAGIGVELITGVSQFDLYLNPYLRSEAGIVHLDLGYVIPLVRPIDGDELTGANVGIAVVPKPFTLAYGLFGFELGLDFGLRAATQTYGNTSTFDPMVRFLLSLVASGRIGFGVTYSFGL